MTNEEAKKMLKAKLDCLIYETAGCNYDCNNHLCDGCNLNYAQGNMGEQKEALEMAIKALSSWSMYSDELWKKAYARGYNDAKTLEQQQYKKVLIKDHDAEPITYRGILDTEKGIVYMKNEPLERLKHYEFTIEEVEE